jgi:hypothetical protein
MEQSPLEAKTSRERAELLSGIRDQVGPLAAPPTDAAVVYVHGHSILVSTQPAGGRALAFTVPRAGELSPGSGVRANSLALRTIASANRARRHCAIGQSAGIRPWRLVRRYLLVPDRRVGVVGGLAPPSLSGPDATPEPLVQRSG